MSSLDAKEEDTMEGGDDEEEDEEGHELEDAEDDEGDETQDLLTTEYLIDDDITDEMDEFGYTGLDQVLVEDEDSDGLLDNALGAEDGEELEGGLNYDEAEEIGFGSMAMNLWKSEETLERGSGGRRATTVLVRSVEGLQVSCNMGGPLHVRQGAGLPDSKQLDDGTEESESLRWKRRAVLIISDDEEVDEEVLCVSEIDDVSTHGCPGDMPFYIPLGAPLKAQYTAQDLTPGFMKAVIAGIGDLNFVHWYCDTAEGCTQCAQKSIKCRYPISENFSQCELQCIPCGKGRGMDCSWSKDLKQAYLWEAYQLDVGEASPLPSHTHRNPSDDVARSDWVTPPPSTAGPPPLAMPTASADHLLFQIHRRPSIEATSSWVDAEYIVPNHNAGGRLPDSAHILKDAQINSPHVDTSLAADILATVQPVLPHLPDLLGKAEKIYMLEVELQQVKLELEAEKVLCLAHTVDGDKIIADQEKTIGDRDEIIAGQQRTIAELKRNIAKMDICSQVARYLISSQPNIPSSMPATNVIADAAPPGGQCQVTTSDARDLMLTLLLTISSHADLAGRRQVLHGQDFWKF
ncbi:hypothetical protein BD769DRAFT_1663132 [Suillus cothurnatus]|nr:hypothetical protein BD769DRAFT_1663132 [Suillus cothurnatus]